MRQDTDFGRLSGRQLTLRWIVPLQFEEWTDHGFRFSLRRFVNPVRWLRTIFSRWGYDFWYRYHRDSNHRCYCPIGVMFDGSIKLAGWGVVWFYSHYTGSVPCPCDEAMKEMFGDEDSEIEATHA